MTSDPHANQPVVAAGAPLGEGDGVVILIHGRGAGPRNILDLLPRLDRPSFTYLAPGAAGGTWYPLSFLAEIDIDDPHAAGLPVGIPVQVAPSTGEAPRS